MAKVKLPPGWEQHVYSDELMWWDESWRAQLGDEGMLFVSAYPCVAGFFVTHGYFNDPIDGIYTIPVAGPFKSLHAAIAAATLVRP